MATATDKARNPQQVSFKEGDWCHIELPAHDRERAKRFYGEIFGWTFQDVPEMDYTLYQTPGNNSGGGFFTPSERMPEKVINYITVNDIAVTSKKIEEFGGKVIGEPVDVQGHGKMQYLLDSEGTLIALWQGT
jgi:predicted enzyme related to lactoylglutathione lyase